VQGPVQSAWLEARRHDPTRSSEERLSPMDPRVLATGVGKTSSHRGSTKTAFLPFDDAGAAATCHGHSCCRNSHHRAPATGVHSGVLLGVHWCRLAWSNSGEEPAKALKTGKFRGFGHCPDGGQEWRRGRDSNPRYACTYSAFRVRRDRPLCHLSAAGRPGGRPWS
jgi:hypothetical protein